MRSIREIYAKFGIYLPTGQLSYTRALGRASCCAAYGSFLLTRAYLLLLPHDPCLLYLWCTQDATVLT